MHVNIVYGIICLQVPGMLTTLRVLLTLLKADTVIRYIIPPKAAASRFMYHHVHPVLLGN
jgi:hypothetical protein